MENFKIKYAKKFVYKWLKLGVFFIAIGIFPMVLIEDSIKLVPFLMFTPLGIACVTIMGRILVNGRVFAKIDATEIKLLRGKPIKLGEIQNLATGKDGRLYVQTKGGRRVEILNKEWGECTVNEVAKAISDLQHNRKTNESMYDQTIKVSSKQLSSKYEVICALLAFGAVMILSIINGMMDEQVYLVLSIVTAIVVVAIIAMIHLFKKDVTNITITNEALILETGEIVNFREVKGTDLQKRYKYLERNQRDDLDNEPYAKRVLIRERLWVVLEDGRQIELCTTRSSDYTPQELQRLVNYKLKQAQQRQQVI